LVIWNILKYAQGAIFCGHNVYIHQNSLILTHKSHNYPHVHVCTHMELLFKQLIFSCWFNQVSLRSFSKNLRRPLEYDFLHTGCPPIV